MKYGKPPLTFEQQADLLLGRGLSAEKRELVAKLRVVNYYRLSGYLFPFRNPDNTFRKGTTLAKVWRRYTFDRRLRLLALDAIERVEVSMRTSLTYRHAHLYGPFGYTRPDNLPKLSLDRHGKFLARIYHEAERSHEAFVGHFKEKYADHSYLPLWMAAEIMPFGVTLTLFNGVEPGIKRAIAETYRVPDTVLSSWMQTLNVVRNICAHHGRLWNRELGVKPKLPKARKYPEWHEPVPVPNNRVFAVLTILRHLLGVIAPQSCWAQRLTGLLDEYKDVPKMNMGFPEEWRECPIWQ